MGLFSKKKQTIGYWYRLLVHWGWCKSADALLEFRGGDKIIWKGVAANNTRIGVNRGDVWGGEKSEGGMQGEMDIQFGRGAQGINDYLYANLGPEQPTYRAKTTIAWRGGRYGTSRYPKNVAGKFRRIFEGWDDDVVWYPEKAAVPLVPPTPLALYFALDLSGSMDEITDNGLSRLTNAKTAINGALDSIAEQVIAAGTVVDIIVVGWSTSVQSITRRNADAAAIAALKSWVSGRTTTGGTDFAQAFANLASFFGGAPGGSRRIIFFITDGEPSPTSSASVAAGIVAANPGVEVYGINIDLDDTDYTEMVDNTPGDGVPVVSGSNPGALTNTILSLLSGLIGMNAAHILYDSLTQSDMMGEPAGLISEASFRAAADRLYSEGFGLCTSYEDEEITAFQQRICDVIGACLTQSRVDGLYYLDLIRPTDDIDDLLIITADDVIEFQQEPTLITEQINQVTVEWVDSERKEKRATTPLQALGAIQAAGMVIPEIKSYPEIAIESLALRVAGRDLNAKSAPLSRFTLMTKRKPWKLRPGQKFRLQLPAEGIADMVCLVGDIDLGTPTDGRVRLKAVQDVFSFPDSVYVQSEPGLATPPTAAPEASPNQIAIEMPYVELFDNLPSSEIGALPPGRGFLLTAATKPPAGLGYDLYTAANGGALAATGNGDWCPTAQIVDAADYLDTNFTLTGGLGLADVTVGSWALWGAEIVRVDALDANAGTITLGRGCADTVPAPHAAGSRIYFCASANGSDEIEYVAGDIVNARLLTRTASDQQPIASAMPLSVTMASRQARPYPPARLLLNGQSYPTELTGNVTVVWAHRDRILQAGQLTDTTAMSIGPEPGTTYIVRVFDDDTDVLKATLAEIDGDEVVILDTAMLGAIRVRVAVHAVRDGLGSCFAHVHAFDWSSADNRMQFEDGYTPPNGDDVQMQFSEME